MAILKVFFCILEVVYNLSGYFLKSNLKDAYGNLP